MSFAELDKKQKRGSKGEIDEPKAYDARNEYRQLLDLVAKEDSKRESSRTVVDADSTKPKDVYQELMSKERRVLDTVDRVVNDAAERRLEGTVFHRMPLHEIIMRTLGALHALWDDLLVSTSPKEVWEALIDKGRMPFIGLACVVLSVTIAVIHFVQ